MNEKFEDAMSRLSGVICALNCLYDPLKEAAQNSVEAQAARTILLGLESELDRVYMDLAAFGKGETPIASEGQ